MSIGTLFQNAPLLSRFLSSPHFCLGLWVLVCQLGLASIRAYYFTMRVQVLIICILVGLLGWGLFYGAAKNGYRFGQGIGVVPNLHIKDRVRGLWKDDDETTQSLLPHLPSGQMKIAS